MDDGSMKFKCNPKGLYALKVSNKYLKEQSHLINTVKEDTPKGNLNKPCKRAEELYHIVGMPTIESFKVQIKMNAIRKCPVTTKDVNIAKKIFGADMLSLKGKSTRCKLTPVREDIVKIAEKIFDND
jgi:hypothetical protein